MNTKLLKQKILDLAIRGKLTQQLKSDGTAKDLLKQISEQKRESSSTLSSPRRRGSPSAQSEKTIIPLDKNEAPFEIPANWEWVRLGDVFNMQAGKNIATGSIKSEFEDGLFPCYGGNGLRGYVSCYNREGDFPLIGRQGALCGNVNRATGKFYATEHAVVVEVPANINVSCACHFLTQLNLNQYASSTAQPGLSVAKINEVPIPLPPLAEQQRIVEKIQEAFAEIDSIENNKELLKTHIKQARQKILDLAIHGKLVPQNKTDEPASVLLERITRDNPHYEKLTDIPFEIPDSWEWVMLGTVCKVFGRIGFRGYTKKDLVEKGTGAISLSPSNMDGMKLFFDNCTYISWDKYYESPEIMLDEGDVVVVKTGSSYGKTALVNKLPEKATLNPQLMVLKQIDCNHDYLNFFLNTAYFRKHFEDLVNGTAIPTFSQEKFSCKLIPLPPLAEQKRIVDRIEEIFASLDEISLHLV